MKYCVLCRAELEFVVPAGDDRNRHVCPACGHVHYQNPKMVVGCLPVWNGDILLCRRAIEPRKGYWTLPAGFLEDHETLQEGAARETVEESGARVEIERLHTVFNLPSVSQVYFLFLARMTGPHLDPGPESLEARLFSPGEIPWSAMAFRAVEFCLDRYLDQGDDGHTVHMGSYVRGDGPWILRK